MDAEKSDEFDQAVIAEHAQRTVERSALRKVRKALDQIDAAEISERRALRKVLLLCVLLALLGGWFFWGLIFGDRVGDRGLPKPPPMKIPQTLQRPE